MTYSSIEAERDLSYYFRERLEAAMNKRGLRVDDATELYLVHLLAEYGIRRSESMLDQPLVFLMEEALQTSEPHERYRRFRSLGDLTLYISGFFSEYLLARGLSHRYVASIGGRAYQAAASFVASSGLRQDRKRSQTYHELAERFLDVSRVFDDVRESTSMRTPQDIVRLYDRWRRTRSPLIAERLREEGVYPQGQPRESIH